jgi:hypothetical protein
MLKGGDMKISLRQIWKSKWKIFEGIRNSWFKKKHIEKIATKRMSICKACPNIDLKGDKCMIPGTAPCCGLCYKTRSMSSSCDINKWKAVMKPEQEDKLYNKLDYDPDQG